MRNLLVIVIAAWLAVACGTSPDDEVGKDKTQDALELSAENRHALMTRWNDAVDAVMAPIDFHWPSFEMFPHPTYKGGSSEAYEQFAAVLLKFLQDNSDFLASEDLFQTELRDIFPSGDVGVRTTFRELAAEFSSTKSGDIPQQTRAALAGFVDGISQDDHPGDEQTPDAGQTPDALEVSVENQRALMTHWNAAVDAVMAPIDFHWRSFDKFPHPTYKGGSSEAYEQYAPILLRFLQDSSDFLVREALFQTELRYIFPNGGVGLRTTFPELAAEFSATTVGNIPKQTRQALAAFVDRK